MTKVESVLENHANSEVMAVSVDFATKTSTVCPCMGHNWLHIERTKPSCCKLLGKLDVVLVNRGVVPTSRWHYTSDLWNGWMAREAHDVRVFANTCCGDARMVRGEGGDRKKRRP